MSESTVRIVTKAEVEEHKTKKSCYLLIHGKVYDVTAFLDEHPGGDDVVLVECGKDATDAFEDQGHSEEAREIMADFYIGDYEK